MHHAPCIKTIKPVALLDVMFQQYFDSAVEQLYFRWYTSSRVLTIGNKSPCAYMTLLGGHCWISEGALMGARTLSHYAHNILCFVFCAFPIPPLLFFVYELVSNGCRLSVIRLTFFCALPFFAFLGFIYMQLWSFSMPRVCTVWKISYASYRRWVRSKLGGPP